jgi:hypothetical protein
MSAKIRVSAFISSSVLARVAAIVQNHAKTLRNTHSKLAAKLWRNFLRPHALDRYDQFGNTLWLAGGYSVFHDLPQVFDRTQAGPGQ